MHLHLSTRSRLRAGLSLLVLPALVGGVLAAGTPASAADAGVA